MGQQLATVGGKSCGRETREDVRENAQHFNWEDSSRGGKEYFINKSWNWCQKGMANHIYTAVFNYIHHITPPTQVRSTSAARSVEASRRPLGESSVVVRKEESRLMKIGEEGISQLRELGGRFGEDCNSTSPGRCGLKFSSI